MSHCYKGCPVSGEICFDVFVAFFFFFISLLDLDGWRGGLMCCRFIFSVRNDRACVKLSLARLEHHLTWPPVCAEQDSYWISVRSVVRLQVF